MYATCPPGPASAATSAQSLSAGSGGADFLAGIVPTSIVTAFTELDVLQIVFLGVVLGAAAIAPGDKAEPFLAFSRSVLDLVQKALWWSSAWPPSAPPA
ncbi:hypothetical protein GCM10009733_030780 [Nonomuraea maheshkhaliensis]|uniref:Cation/H+ exchanger domain-containing protein n=1 Tax=Nonomuraea maheshkhaliensis TaxID=419590 RepID=A0ABN2F7Q7_9ACTN